MGGLVGVMMWWDAVVLLAVAADGGGGDVAAGTERAEEEEGDSVAERLQTKRCGRRGYLIDKRHINSLRFRKAYRNYKFYDQ